MTLRWILGIVMAVASIAFIAIAVIGGGFRRSFTGSDNAALFVVAAVVCGGLVMASLIWPERRLLMHVVAVLMLGLCIACVFVTRETMFVASIGLLYAIGWFAFYYRTVWATASPQATPF